MNSILVKSTVSNVVGVVAGATTGLYLQQTNVLQLNEKENMAFSVAAGTTVALAAKQLTASILFFRLPHLPKYKIPKKFMDAAVAESDDDDDD